MKKTNYRCPKCGELLYTQTEYGDYSYQCLQCDEDFFDFEAVSTETIMKSKKGYEGNVELILRENAHFPYLVRVNGCKWQTTRHQTLKEAENMFAWRSRSIYS